MALPLVRKSGVPSKEHTHASHKSVARGLMLLEDAGIFQRGKGKRGRLNLIKSAHFSSRKEKGEKGIRNLAGEVLKYFACTSGLKKEKGKGKRSDKVVSEKKTSVREDDYH